MENRITILQLNEVESKPDFTFFPINLQQTALFHEKMFLGVHTELTNKFRLSEYGFHHKDLVKSAYPDANISRRYSSFSFSRYSKKGDVYSK